MNPEDKISFRELDKKTDEEIQDLLEDESSFAQYFYSLAQIKGTKDFNDEILSKNAAEARANLERAQELSALKSKIEGLLKTNKDLRIKMDKLIAIQSSEQNRFRSEHILEQLRQLVHSAEEKSEAIAQSYADGKLTDTEFIKQFQQERELYHLRHAKLERMIEHP